MTALKDYRTLNRHDLKSIREYFRRKVTGKVNAIGRRFFAGDIVEKRDKEFLHYYINENKDEIDLLVSPACNISGDNYEKLLDESEDI